MYEIREVVARQIIDSRGLPTVEAEVHLAGHFMGRAAVPSGASTGSHEAFELRDTDLSVGQAVDNIRSIIRPALLSLDPTAQQKIDKRLCELDGTDNKSNLGANAILAVSLATAKAAAESERLPLFRYVGGLIGNENFRSPLALMNFINGGKHAAGSTDIQEFMIVPVGAHDMSEQVYMGYQIFRSLKQVLSAAGYPTTTGDEGGFAPPVLHGNAEALDLLQRGVETAGYSLGTDVEFALDVAATELYANGAYLLPAEDRGETATLRTADDMIDWYQQLAAQYPILSIEDGLAEDDWTGWQKLTAAMGETAQIVGDDLLVTNPKLVARAISEQAANTVLIKPNQIGTLSETIETVQVAKAAGWTTIMSHRSGETEDTTIAHLAVGLGTDQIKTGSMARGERTAKYNELLRIEEQLHRGPIWR